MGIIYNKLWKLLIDKRMNKGDLQRATGIGSATMAKLSKGENVQTKILVKICNVLDCDTSDIMEMPYMIGLTVSRQTSDWDHCPQRTRRKNNEQFNGT